MINITSSSSRNASLHSREFCTVIVKISDNCCTATIFFTKGCHMFKNTPFESIAKSMTEGAGKFNPEAMQDVVKSTQENLKAWAELGQSQVQAAQAAAAENLEVLKGVKEPQAAMEAMKASAEQGVAMATRNLKEVTALAVSQFKANVDAIEKAHPAPEAFASVAKGLKEAASTLESNLDAAMQKGATAADVVTDVYAKASAKKARAS